MSLTVVATKRRAISVAKKHKVATFFIEVAGIW